MTSSARWWPAMSVDFTAAARNYALDLLSSLLLFVGASVMAGRVWRFPFDDEVYTLGKAESMSAFDLVIFYLNGKDVHPPLSYVLIDALHSLGMSEPSMRFVSLTMTAAALVLFHLLALTLIVERERVVAPATRLIAVLLFGLCALAVSQGDALRWYPLFSLLVAAFVTLYQFGANGAARLAAAAALGLAASTNFLAALVIGPLALYRYGLQRRFSVRCDLAFWLVVALFGAMALCTGIFLLTGRGARVGAQVGHGFVEAVLTNVLGFFGGHSLGLGQAWIVVPAVAIGALAMISVIDRRQQGHPAHLLLLMLAAAVVAPLIGFAKPRSFLYLAPVLAAVLTLYLDRFVRRERAGVAILLSSLIVAGSVAAVANIEAGPRPFKRNMVIPYATVIDFIRSNETGRVLVFSSDPALDWVLRHQYARPERCSSHFTATRVCFDAGRGYDTVFIVSGHHHLSGNRLFSRKVDEVVAGLTAGRHKVATLHAGRDEDAALKSRLTGVPLDNFILTVDLYR